MATKYFGAPAGAGAYNWVGGGYWYLDLAHTIPTIDPTNADDVLFDSGFPSADQIANVNAIAYCLDMDWTGATNNPTLAFSASLNYSGNATFIALMVVTSASATNYLQTAGSGTHLLTTNGLTLYSVRATSTGTLSLQDSFTSSNRLFVDGSATFLTNNNTVNTGIFYLASATATLTLGSSVINLSGSWSVSADGIVTPNTATINCSGNFAGRNITTYNIINLTGATSTVSGNFTCAEFNLASGTTQTINFTAGQVMTVTSAALSGSVGHVHTLTGAGTWSIVKAGGGTVLADYVTIRYCQARPTNTWYARPPSTDNGGNTGVIFANTKGNPLSKLVNAGII